MKKEKITYSIAALMGDSIGQEVLNYAIQALGYITLISDFDFYIHPIPSGGNYYLTHGVEWPSNAFKQCQEADAILLGAVVGYEVKKKPYSPLRPYPQNQLAGYAPIIANRQHLNLYANLCPIKQYDGIKNYLSGRFQEVWPSEEVDYVIIKENIEDAYTDQTWDWEVPLLLPLKFLVLLQQK